MDRLSTLCSLFDVIHTKLSQKNVLEPDIRYFLLNVYGLDSDEEIRYFLVNELDEAISFFDLFLSPDEKFQIQIERLLPVKGLSENDVADLIHCLSKSNLSATILFEHPIKQLSINIPFEIITSFVHRLYLNRKIPSHIRDVLTTDNLQKWRIFVQLRNKKMNWTDQKSDFIARILQIFLNDRQLNEILSYMLNFCTEHQDKQEDYLFLLKQKKRQLIQDLYRYNHGQALHEKYNMEYLLLSGIRSVHVDVDKTNLYISIINKVLKAVFDAQEIILPDFFYECK
jgi:hypothetical protein